MFLEFYNLREQPFGVTPDPRYLYLSPSHREALASLFYGIETGRGFLSLVAPPGMGKTTLLFQLLKRWKGYVHSAFLFQTQCDSRELLCYLLEDLGLNGHDTDIVRMHSELNDFLYREANAGKPVVVFIDEAQNLSDTVLETVRLLSDFEAPDKKLLQIVLAGQPELAKRLSHPGLTQLHQRISIQARLDPLPAVEAIGYIHHRLQVAGYEGPELFTPGAFALISECSRGIPRVINNICFNALTVGCATCSEKITAEVVREACADLSLNSHSHAVPTPQPRPALAAVPSFREHIDRLYDWTRGTFLSRRLLHASVLFLLFVSSAIYVATRSGARTNAHSVDIHKEAANVPVQRAAQPPAPLVASTYPSAPPKVQPQPATDHRTSTASFVYVVQPSDTLRDLCMATVGRYDHTVLMEIQKLNPQLSNPNRLEVGQEIRFPLDIAK